MLHEAFTRALHRIRPPAFARGSANKPAPNASSFMRWVQGEPITTPAFPLLGRQKVDFGTAIMSFGATASLTGFLMSDVLHLRSLSILGSTCGLIFNYTRSPRQLVACGWGSLFISINLFMITRLLMERREITFRVEEASLYHSLFRRFGVTPIQFKRLMAISVWTHFESGDAVIESGEPLDRVLLVAEGGATCFDGATKQTKYRYSAGQNGCIIGATAVAEPERHLGGRPYPNDVVADEDTLVVSFDREALLTLLETDRAVEAALVHTMYVDLLRGLRRNRIEKNGRDTENGEEAGARAARARGEVLRALAQILKVAVGDDVIHPSERRAVREFNQEHSVTDSEMTQVLEHATGWTADEWEDGAREEHACFSVGTTKKTGAGKEKVAAGTATMVHSSFSPSSSNIN